MQRLLIRPRPEQDLADCIECCHAAAELQALLETEAGLEVYVETPEVQALRNAGLWVEELPWPEGPPRTGLEDDSVIWITADLWVHPPWVPAPQGVAGIGLCVPRGLGFGSGEHASTQAMLRLMHRHWGDGVGSCLDVGTGSGILLAYAAARGCAVLAGCDLDGPGLREARELLPQADLHHGGPEGLADPADLVCANMFAAELTACAPQLRRLWNGRGPLLVAGMRSPEEEARVCAALGSEAVDREAVGGFVALRLG